LEENMEWDIMNPNIISMRIPWDILKSYLWWFIWCQKCDYDIIEGVATLALGSRPRQGLARAWAKREARECGRV
jgi:hypothetical protein